MHGSGSDTLMQLIDVQDVLAQACKPFLSKTALITRNGPCLLVLAGAPHCQIGGAGRHVLFVTAFSVANGKICDAG